MEAKTFLVIRKEQVPALIFNRTEWSGSFTLTPKVEPAYYLVKSNERPCCRELFYAANVGIDLSDKQFQGTVSQALKYLSELCERKKLHENMKRIIIKKKA